MQKWRLKGDEEGIKLLDFLQNQLKGKFPNREIKRQIENHRCKVNGVVERFASKRLKGGDSIQWDDATLGVKLTPPAFEPSRILWEDEALLIYDKPPGVTCDVKGIVALLKPHGDFILVHRLDKETSGILLLAKSNPIEEQLLEAFRKRQVHKEYLALVDGCPKEIEGVIKNYLGKIGSFHGQTIYGAVAAIKGLEAKTAWFLKKASKQAALLLCLPETGRTHQIRAHLSGMGHPILGDYQYGKRFRSLITPPRMLLHASKITFELKGKKFSIEAPLPADFQKAIKQIW